ncbi:hypothetical protein F7O84_05515 [Candidatus Galacturonibacter soehngenii]|uniref:Uncharacterized protein n=1 Tax=Candidatus Galacturonatibacter soehngenii TaxID=2307010 RepID=A0A7V7QMD5_9FIRM|nr:hypothetical protein [Candidatus Galacturonibacter soehngenii]KAB1439844.1 hypothetical protein F7O84_05515 [Candidatus Galacturonibacter soehngenii]
MANNENEKVKEEVEEKKDEKIKATDQLTLDKNKNNCRIHLLSIMERLKDMNAFHPTRKQRSMNMSFGSPLR